MIGRRSWPLMASFLVAAACASHVPPEPPARTPVVATTEREAMPPPEVEPADEVPALPAKEKGQHELLKEIESTCDVVAEFHRHPPDLGSVRCLEQLDHCLPQMHALTLLAQSRFAEVRGKALVAAAVLHNQHRCRAERSMHPCSADRVQNQLGDSALCAELAWLPRALAAALTDTEMVVRKRAAEGLMNTQIPADLLVPPARQLLRGFRPGPQSAEGIHMINVLLMALRMAGPAAAELTEDLDRLLLERDLHDERVVANALHVVAGLADRGAPLEERVVAALRDRRRTVRLAAVEALGAVGDETAAKHLTPLLHDRDATVRQVARAVRRRLTAPFARRGIGF